MLDDYHKYAADEYPEASVPYCNCSRYRHKSAGKDHIDFLDKVFINTGDSYSGITGKTILNEYGDRKFGYYDFWAIADKDDTNTDFHWVRVGRAQFASGN
jgi:hypothetical protein